MDISLNIDNYFLRLKQRNRIANQKENEEDKLIEEYIFNPRYIEQVVLSKDPIIDELVDIFSLLGKIELLKYSHSLGFKLSSTCCEYSIASGSLDCLVYIHQNNVPWESWEIESAIKYDQPNILHYLHETGHLDIRNEKFANIAAKYGRKECLDYLINRGCRVSIDTFNESAASGNLSCLSLLYECQCPWNKETVTRASCFGNLSAVKFLIDRSCPCEDSAITSAAKNGYLDILEFLFENNAPINEVDACYYACIGGHLKCIHFLHSTAGCRFYCFEMAVTASQGHLDCLRYLYEEGKCDFDIEPFREAASHGHLECVKYLYKIRAKWNGTVCSAAANSGKLGVLSYLHKVDCPWDEDTCSKAALNGHLNCLEYAHQNNCPWDEETCTNAARNGHLNCLRYAHENGCQWSSETYRLASLHKQIPCLEYLIRQGCPTEEDESFDLII